MPLHFTLERHATACMTPLVRPQERVKRSETLNVIKQVIRNLYSHEGNEYRFITRTIRKQITLYK